jgi:hypothetical protein
MFAWEDVLLYNALAKLQGSLIRVRAERAQFNSVPCQLQRSLDRRRLEPA